MIAAMGDRNSVQTTDRAVEALQTLADATKLPKKIIVERTLAWLAQQDEVVRGLVLGMIPAKLTSDAARVALQSLSQNTKKAG